MCGNPKINVGILEAANKQIEMLSSYVQVSTYESFNAVVNLKVMSKNVCKRKLNNERYEKQEESIKWNGQTIVSFKVQG